MLHVPGVGLNDKLRLAASKGHTLKVLELFELGATCDADREGRTALHFAAHYGHLDTVTSLILNGCDVNTPDFSGHTALQRASAEGHLEIVQQLVKHGAHVDHQDDIHGNTALHEAAWKGYSQTMEILCKAKANVYIKNKGGFAPLHLACQNGHNQSCRVLLLAGCKPDIKNNYGDTPLHTSARYGHAGVIRILISANCNVSDQNKNDDTALHISSAMGRRKLTRILLEAGCNQSLQNKQGETAKDIVRRKNFSEVEAILRNPPPLRKASAQQRYEQPSKKSTHKKRDKDSGTSKDSKDSGSRHKSKSKKTKHVYGSKAHSKSGKEWGHWSPYGCHYSPNISSSFPTTNLDSLPKEPLKKGEQYYLDLAGNIRKGPIGVGYACYCVPFFQHVEQKMENDKQELMEHIDLAHDDLNVKISNLERRTRVHLFNINQGMKECLAADKAECLEKVERMSQKEHVEMERIHLKKSEELKMELKSWIRSQVREPRAEAPHGTSEDQQPSEDEEQDSEESGDEAEDFRSHFASRSARFMEPDLRRSARHSRRFCEKSCTELLSRSKSEEVISERNYYDSQTPGLRVLSQRERGFGRSHGDQLDGPLYSSEQDKENKVTSSISVSNLPPDVQNWTSRVPTTIRGLHSPRIVSAPQSCSPRGQAAVEEPQPRGLDSDGFNVSSLNVTRQQVNSLAPQHRNPASGVRPDSRSGSRIHQQDGELHDSQDHDSGYTTKLHSSFESQSSTLNAALSPPLPHHHQNQFHRSMNQHRLQQLAAEFGDPNEPEFATSNRQFLDTITHETDKWYERRLQSIERRASTTPPSGMNLPNQPVVPPRFAEKQATGQFHTDSVQPLEVPRARTGFVPRNLQQTSRMAASPPVFAATSDARTTERPMANRNTSSLV